MSLSFDWTGRHQNSGCSHQVHSVMQPSFSQTLSWRPPRPLSSCSGMLHCQYPYTFTSVMHLGHCKCLLHSGVVPPSHSHCCTLMSAAQCDKVWHPCRSTVTDIQKTQWLSNVGGCAFLATGITGTAISEANAAAGRVCSSKRLSRHSFGTTNTTFCRHPACLTLRH